MIIHNGYENLNLSQPAVTIGIFDGVHLGHKALLNHLVSSARRTGGESVVVTFNPHPRLIISKEKETFTVLSTLDEKKKLLADSFIDHLIIMDFTKDLSEMEAVDFIREILVKKIGVKLLVVGYDNHFGRGKGGDFSKISGCAKVLGFEVEQVGEVSTSEGIISSTAIRDALLCGHLEDANRWLGYNYSFTGSVVVGRRLGRSLGFPTANLKLADIHKLIPADGVYAVEVQFDNLAMPGMLSIGFNPTISGSMTRRSIEVHIFNFDLDLYNKVITVVLKFRLRDERKFDTISQLTEQMKLDKQAALKLLG